MGLVWSVCVWACVSALMSASTGVLSTRSCPRAFVSLPEGEQQPPSHTQQPHARVMRPRGAQASRAAAGGAPPRLFTGTGAHRGLPGASATLQSAVHTAARPCWQGSGLCGVRSWVGGGGGGPGPGGPGGRAPRAPLPGLEGLPAGWPGLGSPEVPGPHGPARRFLLRPQGRAEPVSSSRSLVCLEMHCLLWGGVRAPPPAWPSALCPRPCAPVPLPWEVCPAPPQPLLGAAAWAPPVPAALGMDERRHARFPPMGSFPPETRLPSR